MLEQTLLAVWIRGADCAGRLVVEPESGAVSVPRRASSDPGTQSGLLFWSRTATNVDARISFNLAN